jgi:glycine cleavage system aminomethyltransferase T
MIRRGFEVIRRGFEVIGVRSNGDHMFDRLINAGLLRPYGFCTLYVYKLRVNLWG